MTIEEHEMTSDRPDLHTSEHERWDQGGYCNNLVLDDDGSATDCGYQKTPYLGIITSRPGSEMRIRMDYS